MFDITNPPENERLYQVIEFPTKLLADIGPFKILTNSCF